MMCDTGFTLEQIEALPVRMQDALRTVSKVKRLHESAPRVM